MCICFMYVPNKLTTRTLFRISLRTKLYVAHFYHLNLLLQLVYQYNVVIFICELVFKIDIFVEPICRCVSVKTPVTL